MSDKTNVLFQILKGNSSRISTDVTPFHDGWCYFTGDDGGFYIDFLDDNGTQQRVRINPNSRSLSIDKTLENGKWSDDGRQNIYVEGLKATQNGIIGLVQTITDEQLVAAKEAELRICGQTDGTVTIEANGVIPICDIPVCIIIWDAILTEG